MPDANSSALVLDRKHLARFFAKIQVNLETGCWEWTGATRSQGYGVFAINRKTQVAHRVAYRAFAGPIEGGLEIDHLCR